MPGQSKSGFKLFRPESDNKIMKRAILFLLADWERKKCVDRETDRMLIIRLEAAAYRVIRCASIESMHTLSGNHSFDAILVSRRFVEAYNLDPDRHVHDALTEHVIIVWDRDAAGNVSTSLYRNDEFARPAHPAIPDYLGSARAVASALEKPLAQSIPVSPARSATLPVPAAGREPEDQPEPTCHELHRKAALILDAIASGGMRGADIPTISRVAWGTSARDRRKDIQCYVSKLRKFLSAGEGPYRSIEYRDKRYYLHSRPRA